MTHSLLVVEGAHDASFFGHLARARDYKQARILSEVPEFWRDMIPSRYPLGPEGRLDRVIRFPEVYANSSGNTLGISVAGGDDRIVAGLRTPLERLGVASFTGIGIALDTDHILTVHARFNALMARLADLNTEASAEGISGFPLSLPTSPGLIGPGTPKIGVYLFPDNARQGLLETVLLECAAAEHPVLERSTGVLVRYIDRSTPSGADHLARLRTAAGRAKAQAGMIANALQPGASLAVSIQSGNWLSGAAQSTPCVLAAVRFLTSIL